ncbi:MAG TPA: class I SAM-dependent methyltransferase [Acidobacteriaceae bacterium]|nr:class I SAM-dependent methyltransferase [Acidobacteriaceae bacterium]
MSEQKRDNTARFTGKAEDYDRYRQRYPAEEILTRVREWCGLTPDWLVADIGAGTGMVAEIFLSNGNEVIAVEPNEDMLEKMRAIFARPDAMSERLRIVRATAEATTLEDGSVDLIAVGRAFHWFDKEKALAEFRRILKPGGSWVTLVAADRDRESKDPEFAEQIAAYEDLLREHGTDYQKIRSGYRSYESMENFFDGELHQAQVHGLREMDWESFRGQVMSLSISPRPEDAGFAAFAAAMRAYFDRFSREGILTMPTICWITAARFGDSATERSAEGQAAGSGS